MQHLGWGGGPSGILDPFEVETDILLECNRRREKEKEEERIHSNKCTDGRIDITPYPT